MVQTRPKLCPHCLGSPGTQRPGLGRRAEVEEGTGRKHCPGLGGFLEEGMVLPPQRNWLGLQGCRNSKALGVQPPWEKDVWAGWGRPKGHTLGLQLCHPGTLPSPGPGWGGGPAPPGDHSFQPPAWGPSQSRTGEVQAAQCLVCWLGTPHRLPRDSEFRQWLLRGLCTALQAQDT